MYLKAQSAFYKLYIQQDFIEECHFIFGTKVNKGKLKNDNNYMANREIRNEIIGHPIRKVKELKPNEKLELCVKCGQDINVSKHNQTLLSSSLFSNESNASTISYLLYHKENNYNFEEKIHLRQDILDRHLIFLNDNLRILINKNFSILKLFKKKLIEISEKMHSLHISSLVTILEHNFESIFHYYPLYSRKYLFELHDKIDMHPRYKYTFDDFYITLDNSIKETINSINLYINDTNRNHETFTFKNIDVDYNNEIIDLTEISNYSNEHDFSYEFGKLASPNRGNLDLFIQLLKKKVEGTNLVLTEINNMELNINNKLEYYSSYRYLGKLLKID